VNKTWDAYTLKVIATVGMILQHTAIILEPVVPFGWQIPMYLAGG